MKQNKNRRGSDQPLLNGKPLPSKQNDLKPGDIISIAGFEVEFYSIQ